MAEEWVREGPYAISPTSTSYPDRMIRIMSDGDALKNNLRWAQAAVNEAKSAVRVSGSANKAMDYLRTFGAVNICVGRMRGEWKGNLKTGGGMLHVMTEIAAAARKHGCGNCGELSAIAFIYLFDRRIKVALDWMEVENGDHAFVLLDRAAGSASDPANWGPRCVVADPWKDMVMAATKTDMSQLTCGTTSCSKRFKSAHREDA